MRKILFILAILLIAVAMLFGVFAHRAWFSKEQTGEPVLVTVEPGMTAEDVSAILAEHDLVSGALYRLFGQFDSSVGRPKAGTYAFRKGASYQIIADTIALGPQRDEVTLRFIEGYTLDDNAEALRKHGIDPEDYWALTGRSKGLASFDRSLASDFNVLKAIPNGQSLEGYLFPDTYNVWKDQLPEGVIRVQLQTLERRVIEPYTEAQKASGMSWHEILTLASIVEAEVRQPETRKVVAGIFLNRLHNSMRIQSDATLNYIIDEGRDRATVEDLELDSPYNSYTNDGLPPGPIGNPSLSSIIAVLEPAETDYFFFLTDAKGNIYYAKTHDEHVRNKQKAYYE